MRSQSARVRLLHVMGGDEHRRFQRFLQLAHVVPDGLTRDGVETDGRLVHEQHLRPVQHALGDFEPADHAAGVAPHEVVGRFRQTHDVERVSNARLAIGARNAVQARREQQVLVAGQ